MAEEKKHRSSKRLFVVIEEIANVAGKPAFRMHYSGNQKKKARETAETFLQAGGDSIRVLNVASSAYLKKDHLRSVLPKDAF